MEAIVSLEMGTRLLSVATASQAFAKIVENGDLMLSPADALEPAIDLSNHSLEIARSIRNEELEKQNHHLIATCYICSW